MSGKSKPNRPGHNKPHQAPSRPPGGQKNTGGGGGGNTGKGPKGGLFGSSSVHGPVGGLVVMVSTLAVLFVGTPVAYLAWAWWA